MLWALRVVELYHVPLRAVFDTVTTDELLILQAYANQYGPWWGERADILHAHLCGTVAACHVTDPPPADKFLMKWDRPPRPLLTGRAVGEFVRRNYG